MNTPYTGGGVASAYGADASSPRQERVSETRSIPWPARALRQAAVEEQYVALDALNALGDHFDDDAARFLAYVSERVSPAHPGVSDYAALHLHYAERATAMSDAEADAAYAELFVNFREVRVTERPTVTWRTLASTPDGQGGGFALRTRETYYDCLGNADVSGVAVYALASDIATRKPVKGDRLDVVPPKRVARDGTLRGGQNKKHSNDKERKRLWAAAKRAEAKAQRESVDAAARQKLGSVHV